MCADIADKFGIKDKFLDGKDQEGWTKQIYEGARAKDPRLPSYEEGYEKGVFHYRNPKGYTPALESFIKDPEANKLKTPSGKIEICSEALQKVIDVGIRRRARRADARAHVRARADSYLDCTDEYPFTLCGFHYKARTHSSFGNIRRLSSRQRLRKCGSTPWTPKSSTLKTARPFRCSTIMAKCTSG